MNEISAFYDRFEYPAEPQGYGLLLDEPWLFGKVIAQETGRKGWLPKRILVVGCGRAQALNTALAFPEAEVWGTDISEKQIERCAYDRDRLGVKLDLKVSDFASQEFWFSEPFDYVLCTGVLHHVEDMQTMTANIRAALKPDGLLELMVYNEYHVRPFIGIRDAVVDILPQGDWGARLQLARKFAPGFEADTLVNPVIKTFTARTLQQFLAKGRMRPIQPRTFNSPWAGPPQLPDTTRWNVTCDLLQQTSPLLWFYCERTDSPFPPPTEAQLDAEFARAKVRPFRARLKTWKRVGPELVEAETISFPPDSIPTSRLYCATQSFPFVEVM